MSERTGGWAGPLTRNVKGHQFTSAVGATRGPGPRASTKGIGALI